MKQGSALCRIQKDDETHMLKVQLQPERNDGFRL